MNREGGDSSDSSGSGAVYGVAGGGGWGFSCGDRPISHNCEKKGMIDEGRY